MGNQNWIPAPHRIIDPETECIVYGTGDQVPMHDAVKYGLVKAEDVELGPDQPDAKPKADEKAKTRGRRKAEPAPDNAKPGRKTRARKPTEDR